MEGVKTVRKRIEITGGNRRGGQGEESVFGLKAHVAEPMELSR